MSEENNNVATQSNPYTGGSKLKESDISSMLSNVKDGDMQILARLLVEMKKDNEQAQKRLKIQSIFSLCASALCLILLIVMLVTVKKFIPQVEDAVANANKSLEDFFDDVAAKIEDLEEKGETDSPEYENAQKMAAVLQKFNSMKITAETLAAGHKEEFHTINNRLSESKAGLEFINRKRAQVKLPVLAEADDQYTREIDAALDELSDSLVDCNLRLPRPRSLSKIVSHMINQPPMKMVIPWARLKDVLFSLLFQII